MVHAEDAQGASPDRPPHPGASEHALAVEEPVLTAATSASVKPHNEVAASVNAQGDICLDDLPVGKKASGAKDDDPLIDDLRALLIDHLRRSVAIPVSPPDQLLLHKQLLDEHANKLAVVANEAVQAIAAAIEESNANVNEGGEDTNSRGEDATSWTSTVDSQSQDAISAGLEAVKRMRRARQPPPQASSRKALHLSDEEIMALYRVAQEEAEIEADWRGLQSPVTTRSSLLHPGRASKASDAGPQDVNISSGLEGGDDTVCLRMVSRALQESQAQVRRGSIVTPSEILDTVGIRTGFESQVPPVGLTASCGISTQHLAL